jgi:hypothetical protein
MLRQIAAFVVSAAAVVAAHAVVPPPATLQSDRGGSDPVVRTYDIRPLYQSLRANEDRFPSSTRARSAGSFGGGAGCGGGDTGPYSPPTRAEYVDAICKVIEDTIQSDTWLDNGGPTGSLRCYQGRLIITHTPHAHAQIAELLDALQALSEAQAQPD